MGSDNPALRRLEARGWISSEWGSSENNRRVKFYTLTAKGRAPLRIESATWTRFAHAMFAVLEAPPEPAWESTVRIPGWRRDIPGRISLAKHPTVQGKIIERR